MKRFFTIFGSLLVIIIWLVIGLWNRGLIADAGSYVPTRVVLPPNAPVAFPASNVTTNSFTANWGSSPGATGYRIDVCQSQDCQFLHIIQNLDVGNTFSLNVSGLSGGNYYYQVRAYDGSGTSANSNIIHAPTIPFPPVATAATQVSGVNFIARWEQAMGATGYRLDVATDSAFTAFVIGFNNKDVGNSIGANVDGLSPLTQYFYRARAYSASGVSGNSNTISVTTIEALSVPSAQAATNISTTSFRANWNASVGAPNGYQLSVATDSGFTQVLPGYNNLEVGLVLSRDVLFLQPGITYYYRVRAYNGGGPTAYSNTITSPTIPTGTDATAATSITDIGFIANWLPTVGASGYRLDVSTTDTFGSLVPGYNNLDVGNVLSFPVSGLNPLTNYYYRLRAYNTSGTGTSENIGSLRTAPSPPVAVAASSVSDLELTANWNVSVGASGYYFDLATDSSFTSFVPGYNNLNVGGATSITVTGLSFLTNYYYRLRSFGSGPAISRSSNTINVRTAPLPPVADPATGISNTGFLAHWRASSGAAGYRLDLSTDSSFSTFVQGYANLDTGNVTGLNITGLTSATTYYYRLRAYASAEGASRNSNVVSATTTRLSHVFDYDGDWRTDISVYRPATGVWYLQRSTSGFHSVQFGTEADKLTPADYDGDGKTDIATYRPATGTWYVIRSSDGTVIFPVFGVAEDIPVPGDYDGDGRADLSVFRPSQGIWYRTNSGNGSFFAFLFGTNGDIPTVGDFDGDGKNDLGIFRPSAGDWYNIRSSNGSVFGERFGQTGDRIAPADYDGDGKTDIAIYRPSTGLWVVRNSATATYSYYVFGAANDVPVAGDYDGDGKADIGVWRPSDGTWYIQRSSNSQFIVFPWGQNGDKPTPSAYGN